MDTARLDGLTGRRPQKESHRMLRCVDAFFFGCFQCRGKGKKGRKGETYMPGKGAAGGRMQASVALAGCFQFCEIGMASWQACGVRWPGMTKHGQSACPTSALLADKSSCERSRQARLTTLPDLVVALCRSNGLCVRTHRAQEFQLDSRSTHERPCSEKAGQEKAVPGLSPASSLDVLSL